MDETESKLSTWMRKQAFIDSDHGKLRKLVLRNAAPGKRGNNVLTFKVPEGFTDDDVPNVVSEILDAAKADADGMGGVQRYVINSYFSEGGAEPVGRFPFRMAGHDERYDDSDGEAPTSTGLVAQAQRHLENLQRTSNLMMVSAFKHMSRTIETLSEQNEKLLGQRLADVEMMERLRSEEFERQMTLAEHEGKEARKAALFEKASLLFPVIVNKLSGKKVLPTETTAETESLLEIVRSLDSDQFQKVMGALRPEQQIALVNLIQQFQAVDEARQKQLASKSQSEKPGNGAKE